jgi:hypothetical protein
LNLEAYDAIAECGGISKRCRSERVKETSKKNGKGLKSGKGVDMSNLPQAKTNRKQREDLEARKAYRHKRCQIPGCTNEAIDGVHHIIQKVDIIIDHPLNFLNPCIVCHPECDEGTISQVDQFELKAHEFKTTVERILKDLGEFAGVVLYVDGDRVRVKRG